MRECDVLATNSLSELILLMNDATSKGWDLQGGICATVNGFGHTYYYQAIVKDSQKGDENA